MIRPMFHVEWLEIMAEETSQWATAAQLEAVLEQVFAELSPVDLADFGTDYGFVVPPGLCGEGVAQ